MMDLPDHFTLTQIRQIMTILGLDLGTTASLTITGTTVTVTSVIPAMADGGTASWQAGREIGSVHITSP